MRRALVVAAVSAGLVLAAAAGTAHAGPWRGVPAAQRPVDRLVLVSGRDDHGLLELKAVPLTRTENGGGVIGMVSDGTLARAVDVDGTQVRVRTVEGPALTGWVDDYRLRGILLRTEPGETCHGDQQVVAVDWRAGQVLVRPVAGTATTWVDRHDLSEVVAETACDAATSAHAGHAHH